MKQTIVISVDPDDVGYYNLRINDKHVYRFDHKSKTTANLIANNLMAALTFLDNVKVEVK